MKKLFPFSLAMLLLFSACQTATPTSDGEPIAEIEAPKFKSSRSTTTTNASSELEDDTGWGFAYNSANVLDLDYSTAWCPKSEELPSIALTFSEPTTVGPIGIMPGFGRDEAIYFQNNRLKTVEVWVDDEPEASEELHFEDVYEMQFFDLGGLTAETLTFKVMETYPGSKYSDTCIAEIDLWSDWVDTQDADAAYNYYLKHKEEFALRPVSVANVEMLFTYEFDDTHPEDFLTACGAFDKSTFRKDMHGSDYVAFSNKNDEYIGGYAKSSTRFPFEEWRAVAGMQPLLSARIAGATEQDEFMVKWIQTSFFMALETPQLVRSVTVQPKTCADGTLYISDEFNQAGMGGYMVQILQDGRLLYSADVSLAQ